MQSASSDDEDDEEDSPGEMTVLFGIVNKGNLYGMWASLPPQTTACKALDKLPEGLTFEVKPQDGEDVPSLWFTFEGVKEGRHSYSLRLALEGAELPELLVNVEANVCGGRLDSRPSRCNEKVVLLRAQASCFKGEGLPVGGLEDRES